MNTGHFLIKQRNFAIFQKNSSKDHPPLLSPLVAQRSSSPPLPVSCAAENETQKIRQNLEK